MMANVVMYGAEYCPFCHRARALLDAKNVDYTYIAVDYDPIKRQEMETLSGRHTVPQIFINNTPIGGCDDLYALESNGKLNEILQQ